MEISNIKIKTVTLKDSEVKDILLKHCGLPSKAIVDFYDNGRDLSVDTLEVVLKYTEDLGKDG